MTITVPPALVDKGVSVRVNGHVDNISSRSEWKRVPSGVSREFLLDDTTVEVANAFGGAIYIDVGSRPLNIGDVDIIIEGAIAAPTFILNETTDEEWVSTLRDLPAPQAEFVTDGVAWSVPSSFIRDLDDPTAVMTLWDDAVAVMDYVGDYESLRTNPERINLDVQISAGGLHAGYPAQGPASMAFVLITKSWLQKEPGVICTS